MEAENGVKSQEPRNAGSFKKLEMARKWILSSDPPEGISPADTDFGTLKLILDM